MLPSQETSDAVNSEVASVSDSRVTCQKCQHDWEEDSFRRGLCVCAACGWHGPLTAKDWVHFIVDAGTFKEIGKKIYPSDPLKFKDSKPYRQRLREAEDRTGMYDAALSGEARLDGHPIVIISIGFDFMGGTMGSVVGEKVARAFQVATRRRLPVISILASGGARIQEGMLSLMQMAKTAAAVSRHQKAKLLYVSVLTNPSFGGPFASFASLGDVLIGEPGAEIGFAGSRVVAGTISEEIPRDARKAERLLKHGMIDMVIPRPKLRHSLALLISKLTRNRSREWPAELPKASSKVSRSPIEVIELARLPERPRSRDYVARLFTWFMELHGDRCYGDDEAIIGGLADLHGHPIMLVAQQGGMPMPLPEGYRKAKRLFRLAEKFELPVLTLVDTPGAFPGLEAEHRGIALTIAESLSTLASLESPVLNVVIGEGGSGGALALGLADVILMQQNSIYAVISPEGAAAILTRDASRGQDLLPAMKLRAQDLLELGVIDGIVPEPPGGAHRDPDAAARLLLESILFHFSRLTDVKTKKLLRKRLDRYRSIGRFERGITRNLRNLVGRIRNVAGGKA